MAGDYGFSVNVNGNSIQAMRAIEAEIAKLIAQANTAQQKVSQSFSQMGNSITGTLSSIAGATGIAFGVGGVVAFAKSVVDAGSKVENARTGLTTLLKNANEAGIVIQNTMQDATTTPFAFEGLLAANKALISANVNAVDARKTVLDLANAIAATGGGDDELQRMVVNLQQIKNTGKATAMDIRQFAFAGINIYEALAKATGKPITEVKNLSVSYELLTAALSKAHQAGGIYANGLENMAQNTSVQISNVGDAIFQLSVQMFDDLKPAITDLLSTTQEWIANARQLWEWLVKNKDTVAEVAHYVKIAGEAYLLYKTYLFATAAATRAFIAINTLFRGSMVANTVATTTNTAAAVVNTRTWMGASEAMRMEAAATTQATVATRSFGAAWASVGIGAIVLSITYLLNVISDYNSKIDESIQKVGQLGENANNLKVNNETFNKLNNKFAILPTLDKSTKEGMYDEITEAKKKIQDDLVTARASLAAYQAESKRASTKTGEHMESEGMGQHISVNEYVEQDANKRNELAKAAAAMAETVRSLNAKLTGYNSGLDILAKNGIKKGRPNMGVIPAATQSAINTQALSGARGGLGEAKVINIHIDTVQKNIGVTGKGVENNAENAVDYLIRTINNMAYSQTSM